MWLIKILIFASKFLRNGVSQPEILYFWTTIFDQKKIFQQSKI